MHYNALPIYQLEFQKFCFIKKILENCRYLVKTTFAVYLIIFKTEIKFEIYETFKLSFNRF